MLTEETYVTEDTYVLEKPKMVTVKVQMSDYALEEDRYIAQPRPQSPDEITLREDGAVCVIAKNGKACGTVSKSLSINN